MNDWYIFQGNNQPHDGIKDIPDPPSWRAIGLEDSDTTDRGQTYQASDREKKLVNTALYLRRPLLVTGKPGTGKTSLAYAVAHELQLGPVLYWPITTRSTLKEGLYQYDAIGRAQELGALEEKNLQSIERYIRLGPLGTAFQKSQPKKPRVLLIDEIDKSDIDLPNDLLHIFEEGQFEIPELARIAGSVKDVHVRSADQEEVGDYQSSDANKISRGKVQCKEFPFVIMTSNGERDFPPPFLRRCLRLKMEQPDAKELERIVSAHLGEAQLAQVQSLIKTFLQRRTEDQDRGDLATDQLLNAIYLRVVGQVPVETSQDDDVVETRDQLIDYLFRPLSSSEDS